MRQRPLRSLLVGIVAPFVTVVGLTNGASAQTCDSVSSRTSLAALSGRRIGAVDVVTADPEPLPGPAAVLNGLHVRTRESTIRRELLVAPGDTVDTLRVAESLRRLRQLHFLVDAEVRATGCGSPLDLRFVTRDGWSTKPNVQVSSSTAAVELRERNLLGTGRQATLSLRSDRGRIGIGATILDPAALGERALIAVGGSRYRDGSEWSASIARRERSVLDPWSYEGFLTRSTRAPLVVPAHEAARSTQPAAIATAFGATFLRAGAGALVGRRIHASERAVTSLQAGIEYQLAGLVAASDAPLLGARHVQRELTALDVGLRRRSVAFDTLTWLLPAEALVDVPLSLEFDAVVGVGREAVGGTPIAHWDAWAGRMWRPGAATLAVADLWAAGYRTPGRLSAGTLRGSGTYYHAAPRGFWSARLGAEWLRSPDPDMRAMVTADPTAGALPSDGRLAEAAAALSLERDLRIRPLSHSWALDGAAFAALSTRWDPAAIADGTAMARRDGEHALERLDLGVVGLGLRMAPTRLGRATARLDVGYPLLRSGGVAARPFIALSISPWLQQGRERDGRAYP
ncbi:MAG: hypothetical protein ACYC2G_08420 [Gemmatimonadaceae bacterium]